MNSGRIVMVLVLSGLGVCLGAYFKYAYDMGQLLTSPIPKAAELFWTLEEFVLPPSTA